VAESTEADLRRQRIEKLEKLEALDGRRYPNDAALTHTAASAAALGSEQGVDLDQAALDERKIPIRLAGRVMAVNSFGKAAFLRLKDRTGTIQAYVRKDAVGEADFARLGLTDLGDFALVDGTLMRTRTGELTVQAREFRVMAKGLRPLPEKFHGLKDHETRQRMRYVDLIVNDESRDVFRLRSRIVAYIRRFLDDRDFLEVETPMLHSILGGANARPFRTHHNTLDMDLYLRIAPELFLKRLVVGGFERVYEINRNFRNEGISTRHNPEFTMIEFYQAYATYTDLMDLTEALLRGLVTDLLGRATVGFKGHAIDFGTSFRRLPVEDGLREYCGATDEHFRQAGPALEFAIAHGVPNFEALRVVAKHFGVEELAAALGVPDATVDACATFVAGRQMPCSLVRHALQELGAPDATKARNCALELGMLVFEREVEDHLVQPTFVTDFPLAVSPLSRRKDADPTLVDRFELYVAGAEIANAFSELNDPQDQEARFRFQLQAKATGDEEAMEFDADYVRALEYGMPPTAGEGIGIDRLTMLLTGQENIRDVILFPLLRPES
jgi:lysyl-tRNA synthetase class 2